MLTVTMLQHSVPEPQTLWAPEVTVSMCEAKGSHAEAGSQLALSVRVNVSQLPPQGICHEDHFSLFLRVLERPAGSEGQTPPTPLSLHSQGDLRWSQGLLESQPLQPSAHNTHLS